MLNVLIIIQTVCTKTALHLVGNNVEAHPNLRFQVSGLNTEFKSLCVPVAIFK